MQLPRREMRFSRRSNIRYSLLHVGRDIFSMRMHGIVMALSYRQFCRFWGKVFLLAAIIAAIAGLLTGDGEWVGMLYLGAAVLLVLAVVFLLMERMIREKEPQ